MKIIIGYERDMDYVNSYRAVTVINGRKPKKNQSQNQKKWM